MRPAYESPQAPVGRLYVDGALAIDATWTAGAPPPTPPTSPMIGVIDKAIFEGTMLTPAQVAGTYATNHC